LEYCTMTLKLGAVFSDVAEAASLPPFVVVMVFLRRLLRPL
jgi:hypothetical protein